MRLVFAGTPEFAARALTALHEAGHQISLVLTQPDRPGGRGMREQSSAVKQYALQHGLEVFQPHTLKSPEVRERISQARPEALVIAAYGLILPQAVLDVAPRGALNIHASLLPRWRGAAPIQRAILAGDTQTGISIMRMDAGLDSGPVLARMQVPIAKDDDAGTLHDKLATTGAALMVRTLSDVESEKAHAEAQQTAGVTYARKIEKHEAMLDWSRPASELERAVRAFRPNPGAATKLAGEAWKLWRASVCDAQGKPGELLRADDEGVVIACGEQALQVTELQREGGRRMQAAQFLRGRSLSQGSKFG